MSSWNSSYRIAPRRPRIMPTSNIPNIPTVTTTSAIFASVSSNRLIPTFHILIATAGKKVLYNMLNSLKNELTSNDAITIVFDGEDAFIKSSFSYEWLEGHKSIINIVEQTPNLGFWGHGIRNKYQQYLDPKTTFIMHADDDDAYIEGSFTKLRQLCVDPNTLYIARFFIVSKNMFVPSQMHQIQQDDIGTPCGIIPFNIAYKSEWGHRYGGDFDYYNNIQKYASNTKFLNLTIYKVI